MVRVLLVDDHPFVRHGIRQILIDRLQATVGEAENAESALAALKRAAWDVVVLDISLPEPGGMALLKQLHRERPTLPILVLSVHPADQFATRALAAGALGYVTKNSAPSELIEAIERVRGGRRYLSDAVGRSVAKAVGQPPPHAALSDREYQVFRMLGSGRTASEIAATLGLCVKTVSTYRARILTKLGMRSNAQLMRYAIENGLIEP
jgi:two-component system invasion response regulator UvrY